MAWRISKKAMGFVETLKANKAMSVVVGVSLVLTIALIVTLVVLDAKARAQVEDMKSHGSNLQAVLDVAVEEVEACGKMESFVEKIEDIPGAEKLLGSTSLFQTTSVQNAKS